MLNLAHHYNIVYVSHHSARCKVGKKLGVKALLQLNVQNQPFRRPGRPIP